MQENCYKVTHFTNHDDLELDIFIGYFESTEENIHKIADQQVQTVLLENELHVIHGEHHFVIFIHETEKYQFEMNFNSLDWNLAQAYAELKRLNPEKDTFVFSSVAYGIDNVSSKELSL